MSIKNNRLTTAEYQENFTDIHPPFETSDAALVEANRCLFCYDPPCMKSCPTSINVPKFIKQILIRFFSLRFFRRWRNEAIETGNQSAFTKSARRWNQKLVCVFATHVEHCHTRSRLCYQRYTRKILGKMA